MTPAGVRAYEENKGRQGVYAYENALKELSAGRDEAVPRQQGRLGRLGEAPGRLSQARAALDRQRQEAGDAGAAPLADPDRGQRRRAQDRRLRYRPKKG